MAVKTIGIRHTQGDWDVIEDFLSQNRIDSYQSFLNIRLHKAVKGIEEIDAQCRCEKILKNYFIPEEICAELILLSKKRCVPLTAIVQRNFIDPILLDHAKKSGVLL